jgi:hypothetical protein
MSHHLNYILHIFFHLLDVEYAFLGVLYSSQSDTVDWHYARASKKTS